MFVIRTKRLTSPRLLKQLPSASWRKWPTTPTTSWNKGWDWVTIQSPEPDIISVSAVWPWRGFFFFSGQLPEADADSVQSERSPRDRPARQSEFRRFNGASEMFYQQWIWSKKDKQNCLSSQVFLKEGTLMKLSRKVMQPRVFFLVRLSPKWNHVFLRVFSRGLTTVVCFSFSRFCAVQRRSDVHHSSPVGSV